MNINENTKDMAMSLAKKLLLQDMHHKKTWFKSPWPDENGRYLIMQSHKADDELPIAFPHKRVYYRELGDGWVISVGY